MKKQIIDYIKSVLILLGLSVICATVTVSPGGEILKGHSSIAPFGSEGLPVYLFLQLLLVSMIITALSKLFLKDTVIKDMKPSLRVILATVGAFLTVCGFMLGCGWIPLHESDSMMTIIAIMVVFPCLFACRAYRLIKREREENQQLAEALNRYKTS